jgi:hypothetical protein
MVAESSGAKTASSPQARAANKALEDRGEMRLGLKPDR